MEKFNNIYENVAARYAKASAIPGDYVKIRSNVKSSDWFKSLDDARKNYVTEIISLQDSGTPILFSALKGTQWETNTSGSKEYLADITCELAPGFYQNPLTIPVELVEFDMTRDENRGTRTNPNNEDNPKINHDPEPVKDQDVAVGNSSKIEGGDYKLANESKSSYTSRYLPS